MNQKPMPVDEFSQSIGLTPEQTKAVKGYIINLLIDNLMQMKEEYNQEIDAAIGNLESN